jgi:ABC-2 type transport system ATP-binding protein
MEEADHLADRISVIDVGRIIAEGTSDELKAKVGGDVLHLTVVRRGDTERAATTLATAFNLSREEIVVDPDLGNVQVPVANGAAALVEAVRALDADHIEVVDLGLRRPSLDDVFLSLTGHIADDTRGEAAAPRAQTRGFG